MDRDHEIDIAVATVEAELELEKSGAGISKSAGGCASLVLLVLTPSATLIGTAIYFYWL